MTLCHHRALIQVAILAMIAFLFSPMATGQPENVLIEAYGAQSAHALSPYIEYYEDESWDKTIVDVVERSSEHFKPIQTLTPNFGFTESKIWLRIRVQNKTESVEKWYFHIHENFLQYYDVFVLREDNSIEHLDSHNPTTAFSDRQIDFPELVTALDFAPEEKVTLFLAYSSGGSSNISLSLETEDSFQTISISKTSKNFVSYGMMIILMVTSGLALLILRLPVFRAYFTYVTVTLLFLMHSDGVAFQYFWPQFPRFNSYFSIIIGLAFSIVPYSFARVFLKTKRYHPKIDIVMCAIMILTPIVIIPMAIIAPQMAKMALMALVLLALIMGTFAGFIASLTRFREVRFYLFAWVLGVISAGYMNVRHFFGIDLGQDIELDSIRVGIVVDAVMMGLGVADSYTQELKLRRSGEQESLKQAQLNLSLNNRLLDLEEQYRLAEELATSRDIEMRNTVHDIRAPLHALRLNLQTLKSQGSNSPVDRSDIDDTFSYLESLIAEQLQSSLDSTEMPREASENHISANNDFLLSDILKSVHEMFLPDARAKSLDFRYVETSQQTDLAPLPLMRIITNLVSNAIKYTPSGKVLLGVRRRSKALRIEIHDTGLGLSEIEFQQSQERKVRLGRETETIEGYGYGLAIVRTLAEEHGLQLFISSARVTGTTIILSIPRRTAPHDQ